MAERPVPPLTAVTPKALDAIVRERLEWAARFASAVSHDMGNLALIASILDGDKNRASLADAKASELQRGLLTQIRAVIDAVSLWRSDGAMTVHQCLLKDWWFVHGRMVRQFLPATARVSVQTNDGDSTIDAARLSRVFAAAFIAISAQSQSLERLVISLRFDSQQCALVAGIVVHSETILQHLDWPALLRDNQASVATEPSTGSSSREMTLRVQFT